jgi:DNA polymerase-3 subunit delta'
MSIRQIFCQEQAITALQRALAAERIAHAYIFAGPEGVGKFTTAREWAKLLLCRDKLQESDRNGQFFDSCGRCPSCKAFENQIHPDFNLVYKELLEYTREGKRKKTPLQLSIEVVREFLIERVAARPQLSQCTIYVVRESERLTTSAQNAMLKVIEEPPGHCFIILLCTRLERLLPTILSRCQRIRFGPVSEQKIAERLKALNVEPIQARFWSRFAKGSLGNAIRWAGFNEEGANGYKIKKELVRRLAELKLSGAVETAAMMVKAREAISQAWEAREKNTSKSDIRTRAQKGLVQMIAAAFTDVMKLGAAANTELINSDQRKEIEVLAKRFGPEEAAEQLEEAYKTARWIEGSVNEKLIFEQLLLNLANYDKMRD